MDNFSLTLLGTGSPIPDPERAGPAMLVKAGRLAIVVDAGRGLMMRLASTGLPAPAVSALMLTHLHSDHTQDVNDLLTTRWILPGDKPPLEILGPAGTAELLEQTIEMMTTDIAYRMAHHNDLIEPPTFSVREVSSGTVLDRDGLVVRTALVDHAPADPALGFRFEYKGKALAISGDTRPCQGLSELAAGADVYVQNVVRRSLIEQSPVERLRDVLDYHSNTEEAGATALAAGVSKVVLSHIVPPAHEGAQAAIVEEVRSSGFDGEVVIGSDLLEIEI